MTDPYNTEQDKVKYWQEKHNTEFERAKSYEMDLIYANYRIKELQAEVAELKKDLDFLINAEANHD